MGPAHFQNYSKKKSPQPRTSFSKKTGSLPASPPHLQGIPPSPLGRVCGPVTLGCGQANGCVAQRTEAPLPRDISHISYPVSVVCCFSRKDILPAEKSSTLVNKIYSLSECAFHLVVCFSKGFVWKHALLAAWATLLGYCRSGSFLMVIDSTENDNSHLILWEGGSRGGLGG